MQGNMLTSIPRKAHPRTVNYRGPPSGGSPPPPLARAGLTEEAAHAQGLHFVTHHEDTSSWYSSRRGGLPHRRYKTLVEEGAGRVLGAQPFRFHADAGVNLSAPAIPSGPSSVLISALTSSY